MELPPHRLFNHAVCYVLGHARHSRSGPDALAAKLHAKLLEETENFVKVSDYHRPGVGFTVHQQNRYFVHGILARLTDYVERQSGQASRYLDYVSMEGRNRFEVEHIWANKPERHTAEFAHAADFTEHRNRIGGLLLLPKSFNASYGDLTYADKLPHYNAQNLLARSLNPQAYDHNPGFQRFITASGLPFHAHEQFLKTDLDARCQLYSQLAQQVWNPNDLLKEGVQ